MFTIHSHKGFKEFVKQKGVDFIIEKPPNKNEIANVIKKAL